MASDYKYYNMDRVVAQSLALFEKIVTRTPTVITQPAHAGALDLDWPRGGAQSSTNMGKMLLPTEGTSQPLTS